MLTEGTGAMKPVAVIIVGADALLAARPASPIQLWHACVEAGYDLAVPATWGDELVAGECLRSLGAHHEPVAVMCTCPRVARAVADLPFDLSGNLVATVAPPVAAAKYVRRIYGDRRVHITYAGGCPAAADSAIDAWITPAELLDRFRATEIVLEEQPELFESVLPPDRRRHLSQPGGLPTVDQVAKLARPRRVQEVDDAELGEAIERYVSSGVRTLLDLAPRAGCACSGASPDVAPADARTTVTTLEPPRSSRPVMADPGGLGLSRRLPVRQPVPATEPSARPQAPFAAPPSAKPERERPAAVATRAATRSPLSWHLRERALPQPPTTPRPEQRRTPEGTRAVGASSAAWVAAGSADRPQPVASAPDAETVAAVRALERAAALRSSAGSSAQDGGPPQPATVRDGEVPSLSLAAESPAITGTGAPVSGIERLAGESPAREPETVAATGADESRPPRATPPGGYWFAAPIVALGSDTEVRRPSLPTDAVPDDVGSAGVGAEAIEDAHPEIDDDEEAPPSTSGADTEQAAPTAGAAPIEPVAEPPATPESEPTVEEPPVVDAAPDDVRAELAELFGSSEVSSAHAPPEPTAASTPDAAVAPTRQPGTPGPLPWKWLVGAALLIVAAVAISRSVNARVTTEDTGVSALTGGSTVPGGPLVPGELPSGPDSSSLRPTDSVPTARDPRGAPGNRARIGSSRAARLVPPPAVSAPSLDPGASRDSPARDITAAVAAARDSMRRDSLRPDRTAPIIPPVVRSDSATPRPLTARDLELQAIRDELARRTARLDSMGRALGSLYVAPRPTTPGVPTRPAVPPPTFRDPRD